MRKIWQVKRRNSRPQKAQVVSPLLIYF